MLNVGSLPNTSLLFSSIFVCVLFIFPQWPDEFTLWLSVTSKHTTINRSAVFVLAFMIDRCFSFKSYRVGLRRPQLKIPFYYIFHNFMISMMHHLARSCMRWMKILKAIKKQRFVCTKQWIHKWFGDSYRMGGCRTKY